MLISSKLLMDWIKEWTRVHFWPWCPILSYLVESQKTCCLYTPTCQWSRSKKASGRAESFFDKAKIFRPKTILKHIINNLEYWINLACQKTNLITLHIYPGTINNKQLQIFNLTSLTNSEDVLSATLHYYIGDIQNSSQRCLKSKTCARYGLRRQGHVHLSIWSFASVNNSMRTLENFLINVSTIYRDFISWQWRDITHVVNEAKHHDELLIGISINSQGHRPWKNLLSDQSPYILVYANDSAISEPESVVSTLQRHKGSLVPGLQKLRLHNHSSALPHRTKRSANILLPLQNNELPGPEYPYEIQTWDETSPVESKAVKRSRKKPRKNPRDKNPVLQFDEQTIKKARKKQWNEPKNCARRYLKVDFADIGWSEWIISPKSFDAYYCSGSCQFPMPKVYLYRHNSCSLFIPGFFFIIFLCWEEVAYISGYNVLNHYYLKMNLMRS